MLTVLAVYLAHPRARVCVCGRACRLRACVRACVHTMPCHTGRVQAFNHFDEDKSGTIDTQEIVHAMTRIGQKLTQKQAKDFVAAADADGDGVRA